jgi:hypothetical protein
MTTFTQMFATKDLPKNIKALAGRIGRARKVSVEFQSGPTTVGGAWHTDAMSDGKVVSRETTHSTGSDGESNTWVEEVWSAPVARDITDRWSGAKKLTKVIIGNLADLCPTANVTPEQAGMLFDVSASRPVDGTGLAVTVATPGPFNNLTKSTVTAAEVINPAEFQSFVAEGQIQTMMENVVQTPHNDMLQQLGIE